MVEAHEINRPASSNGYSGQTDTSQSHNNPPTSVIQDQNGGDSAAFRIKQAGLELKIDSTPNSGGGLVSLLASPPPYDFSKYSTTTTQAANAYNNNNSSISTNGNAFPSLLGRILQYRDLRCADQIFALSDYEIIMELVCN